MCEYKLTYYDIGAWAEPIRLLFALSKVPYEDIRIPYIPYEINTLPAEIKQRTPFQQVPILEFGGELLSQSSTIGRFLANKFGFYGKDDWESAMIDELIEAVKDYTPMVRATRRAEDEEARAAAKINLLEVATPKYAGKFSKILAANESGFFVGQSVTLADLVIFSFLDYVKSIGGLDLKKEYPELNKFAKKIESIPEISAWIQKRPNQPF